MAPTLLRKGEIFAGRYRIERSIGAGGMGAVFEAEHLDTERHVALKVLLPHSLVNESARDRFKQEARVAGKIRHPHIVDVLDAGVDDSTNMPFLVMELLEGEDLASRVDRLGPMSAEETVMLLWQIGLALDTLHARSIVHRDLKPENLFLTWTEDGMQVMKLLDFGVAKVISAGYSWALTQDAQGTPVYMAPEQFAEEIRISAASDIYALGMVTFTLLTARHYWGPEVERGMNVFMLARIAEAGPKEPASVRAKRQGASVPEGFDEWFSTVTALVPDERFPTASDAIEALADALGVPLPTQASARLRSRPDPLEAAAPASVREAPLSSTREKSGPRRADTFWRKTLLTSLAVLIGSLVIAYVLLFAPGSPLGGQEANTAAPGSALPMMADTAAGGSVGEDPTSLLVDKPSETDPAAEPTPEPASNTTAAPEPALTVAPSQRSWSKPSASGTASKRRKYTRE
ncbi:MAG: protein kinase [Polyangiaceae bacterium]|nr:protein kinase [Polyangiaceae bacterium]